MKPVHRIGLLVATALLASLASRADAQVVAPYAGCLIQEIGEVAPLRAAIKERCEKRDPRIGASGETVAATYSLYARDLLRSAWSLDSAVCLEVRCVRRKARGVRFVVYPDSVPNAYEILTATTADVIFTSAIMDLIVAVASTVGTDVTRRLNLRGIGDPPTDPDRERYTAADSGLKAWMTMLHDAAGQKCNDVPKYNYPFVAADSGILTPNVAASMYAMILAHELAHIETDGQCGYLGSDAAEVEAACDRIAIRAGIRLGDTPLFPVSLFALMGHFEAVFGPVYRSFASESGDPQNFREIRNWQQRARVLFDAWRTDSAVTPRQAAWLPLADTLLSIAPPQSSCVQPPGGGMPVWGRPAPNPPGHPLTPQEARRRLTKLAQPYDVSGFANAVSNNWSEIVELYLVAGMNANATDSTRMPVLLRAFTSGCFLFGCAGTQARVKTLTLLLDAGASVKVRTEYGSTPAMLTSDTGVLRVVVERGANVNDVDLDGGTALMYAARRGDSAIVRMLLSYGASANVFDRPRYPRADTPQNALMYAAWRDDRNVIATLLDHGADVNARSARGENALMSATVRGDSATVALLLARGALVDAADTTGLTGLMRAARYGNASIARMLLTRGAAPNRRDHRGETALMYAVSFGFPPMNSAMVETLLDFGADPSTAHLFGRTPLSEAIRRGSAAIVELLQRAGAKP